MEFEAILAYDGRRKARRIDLQPHCLYAVRAATAILSCSGVMGLIRIGGSDRRGRKE